MKSVVTAEHPAPSFQLEIRHSLPICSVTMATTLLSQNASRLVLHPSRLNSLAHTHTLVFQECHFSHRPHRVSGFPPLTADTRVGLGAIFVLHNVKKKKRERAVFLVEDCRAVTAHFHHTGFPSGRSDVRLPRQTDSQLRNSAGRFWTVEFRRLLSHIQRLMRLNRTLVCPSPRCESTPVQVRLRDVGLRDFETLARLQEVSFALKCFVLDGGCF